MRVRAPRARVPGVILQISATAACSKLFRVPTHQSTAKHQGYTRARKRETHKLYLCCTSASNPYILFILSDSWLPLFRCRCFGNAALYAKSVRIVSTPKVPLPSHRRVSFTQETCTQMLLTTCTCTVLDARHLVCNFLSRTSVPRQHVVHSRKNDQDAKAFCGYL